MSKGWAVISGATGSIGRAVVEACWEAGYRLLAVGHTALKCAALAEWFERQGGGPVGQRWAVRCLDLAEIYEPYEVDTAQDTYAAVIERLVDLQIIETILTTGPGVVDLLVTCHGLAPQPTDARWCAAVAHQVWRCDVMGAVYLCELVGRLMVAQQRGSIVLVSSAHATATYPHRAPYVMAKASLCALARALAVEWGPANVRVNTISPWQCANERSEAVAAQERVDSGIDTLELYRQRAPLRQLVRPADIAQTVLWLANTASITGTDIAMDCGVRASMWHRPFLEERDDQAGMV